MVLVFVFAKQKPKPRFRAIGLSARASCCSSGQIAAEFYARFATVLLQSSFVYVAKINLRR